MLNYVTISDVEVGDTLDSEGRTRFHCFEPYFHVMGSYPDWFYKYDANQAKSVGTCIKIGEKI